MGNEIQVSYVTGDALYAMIRNAGGQVWYGTGCVFEDWGTSSRSRDDYDLPLTETGGGFYVCDFPEDIAAGRYGVQVFKRVGAVPADGDTPVTSHRIVWTGTGELTAEKMLLNKAVQDKSSGAIDYYDDDGVTVLVRQVPVDGELSIERTVG